MRYIELTKAEFGDEAPNEKKVFVDTENISFIEKIDNTPTRKHPWKAEWTGETRIHFRSAANNITQKLEVSESYEAVKNLLAATHR